MMVEGTNEGTACSLAVCREACTGLGCGMTLSSSILVHISKPHLNMVCLGEVEAHERERERERERDGGENTREGERDRDRVRRF